MLCSFALWRCSAAAARNDEYFWQLRSLHRQQQRVHFSEQNVVHVMPGDSDDDQPQQQQQQQQQQHRAPTRPILRQQRQDAAITQRSLPRFETVCACSSLVQSVVFVSLSVLWVQLLRELTAPVQACEDRTVVKFAVFLAVATPLSMSLMLVGCVRAALIVGRRVEIEQSGDEREAEQQEGGGEDEERQSLSGARASVTPERLGAPS
jgi:hypothetical protein